MWLLPWWSYFNIIHTLWARKAGCAYICQSTGGIWLLGWWVLFLRRYIWHKRVSLWVKWSIAAHGESHGDPSFFDRCVCVVFLWKDARRSIFLICWSSHRGGCFSASPPPCSTHKTIVPTFLLLWQRIGGHTVPEGNKTIHPLLLVYSGDLKKVWNNNKHTPTILASLH